MRSPVVKNLEDSIQRDIGNLHQKLRRIVIDYLTQPTYGIRGPVSNTLLRKWGYLSIKRKKIEEGY